MTEFRFPVLAADVGGTNARFSVIGENGEVTRLASIRINEFASPGDAVKAVLQEWTGKAPESALFAYAGPVLGTRFHLTNGAWELEPQVFLRETGVHLFSIMNDFVAQGLAAVSLREDELIQIGGGKRDDDAPRVIVGPGTGLGVALAIKIAERWAIIPGEGGHIDLGPRTAREFRLWPHLDKRNGRMEAELAVSGPGIENLHRAILREASIPAEPLTAAEITMKAMEDGDAHCLEALHLMITFLARICSDLAVTALSRGGVYLAGGIVPRILPQLQNGLFQSCFEDKQPLGAVMREIPVFCFNNPQSGLIGLEELVKNPERHAQGCTLDFVG